MLKKELVNTRLGRLGLAMRARLGLLGAASSRNPEMLGTLANDAIAETLMISLCGSGRGFLDVGAHIGSVFSRVHRQDDTIRIFAIEADTDKARELRARHSYCTLFECAAGEADGEATFFRNAAQPGYNSLLAQPDSTEVTVQVRRIDDLLADEDIDVIKIDIEGAELGALRGGAGLVERCHPTIFFESTALGENALGYSPTALWEWFSQQGYSVMTPDRVAHDAPGFTVETFLDAHRHPRRTHNFVAVSDTRRDAVRARARAILNVPVPKAGRKTE